MDTETNTTNKSKLKFIGAIIAVVIIALISSWITYGIFEKQQISNKRDDYYNLSDNIDGLFEISNDKSLMFDKASNDLFIDKCLGNNSSILLAYGNYCEKDGVVCRSNNKIILTINDKDITISEASASYINIMDNNVYYRDDITRSLCCYSISDNTSKCIVDSQCGEIVVSKKGISYLDLSDLSLKYIPFNTMEAVQITDDKVESFVVVGNSYFCLKDNKDFGIVTQLGEFELLSSDVDRFFCDGKIAIQKGTNIYFVDDAGLQETQFNNVEGVIVGLQDDEIYIYENQCVNLYKVSTQEFVKTIINLDESDVLKSFYLTQDTFEITTYMKDSSLYVENKKSIPKQQS